MWRHGPQEVEISAREGSYIPPKRSLVVKLHGQKTAPHLVAAEGSELAKLGSVGALAKAPEGWAFDDNANVVWIKLPDQGTAMKLEVTP